MTHLYLPSKLSPRRATGFTLIELMIVVAVVGILAAIAYPSYIDSVRKGNRAEGRAAIASLLQQQERYYTQNNTYVDFETEAKATAASMKDFSGDGTRAAAKYLLVAKACQAPAGGGAAPSVRDCIDIVATPQSSVFTDPDVSWLATNSMGIRRCKGNQSLCWK